MRAEELEGALGAEGRSGFFLEDGRPPQIVGGAGDGFFVGDVGFVLEEQGEGQEGRRDARASHFLLVEGGKVVIFEEARSGMGELCLEALGIEVEVKDVSDIEQRHLRGAFSNHGGRVLQGYWVWK